MKKIVLATVVVLGLSSAAYALGNTQEQCGNGEHKFMGQGQMHKMQGVHEHKGFKKGHFKNRHSVLGALRGHMRELNLTTEQKVKLRAIMQSKREKMRALRGSQGQKPQVNFSSFMNSIEFDKEAFKVEMAKVQAIRKTDNSKLRNQRVEMNADTFSKIFNILTPEQREKLIQLSKR